MGTLAIRYGQAPAFWHFYFPGQILGDFRFRPPQNLGFNKFPQFSDAVLFLFGLRLYGFGVARPKILKGPSDNS